MKETIHPLMKDWKLKQICSQIFLEQRMYVKGSKPLSKSGHLLLNISNLIKNDFLIDGGINHGKRKFNQTNYSCRFRCNGFSNCNGFSASWLSSLLTRY